MNTSGEPDQEQARWSLSVAVRTDTGRVRGNNEDAWGTRWLSDGSLLVVVCDGMGGHEAGEVASRLAVDVVSEVAGADLTVDPRQRLLDGLMRANEAIIAEGKRAEKRGMGTTGVVAIVQSGRAHVGQVGDSRVLHVRNGRVSWRTLDHTRVQALIERGVVREEDARHHPEAGVLTRALGHSRMSNGDPLVPDVLEEPRQLSEGDALILCTDGCHDLIDDVDLADAIVGCSAEQAADRLVAMSLERGGHDNVTVAVVVAGERIQEHRAVKPAPRVEAPSITLEVQGELLQPEPWWFWLAVSGGIVLLGLSVLMFGTALWLAS